MNQNFKTVPNQKVVEVNKEVCNKQNLYATINLDAMSQAAQTLDAGAFKLWIYFAKNQNGFEFALSSREVENNFGMKIKQYNNAVDALIAKGFLVRQGDSNKYCFNEISVITKSNNEEEKENPVITKGNNSVITKKDNSVITKSNNPLLPLEIRNITDNTFNNTKDNTEELVFQPTAEKTNSLTAKEEMIERFKRECGF